MVRKSYKADPRNVKRGWGLCCSKSCAAKKREQSKPGYNPERVARNNFRRAFWTELKDENAFGVYTGRRTSEGYKIYADGGILTAVNEFDEAVYSVDPFADDPGDSEYYDSKEY